ncbi:hypothetical protein [Tenacibaculum jejuense]|uniref:Probable lipoprotein n=1 Tax=Tenacibaculum jejuense TaxID=584609 RepID=A0A238UDH7_9FLAO|nr:hypothetical protein [Tenacibaculum jejuense]SNR17105.1 Probable lipoprotein precursor [Tenacibaculum jejuense]
MKVRYKALVLYLIFVVFSSCKKNEVRVISESGIDVNDFRIELKIDVEGKGYKSFIVYDEEGIKEVPEGYMKNYWDVYLRDSLVLSFTHYKGNKNYKHNYMFNFGLKNDTLLYTIDIQGKNKLLLSNR